MLSEIEKGVFWLHWIFIERPYGQSQRVEERGGWRRGGGGGGNRWHGLSSCERSTPIKRDKQAVLSCIFYSACKRAMLKIRHIQLRQDNEIFLFIRR